MSIREAILISIRTHTGVRDSELALNVMGLIGPMKFTNDEYLDELTILIKAKQIIKLEYKIPMMGEKAIFFPYGTLFLMNTDYMMVK